MTAAPTSGSARGFTLIEVMMSVVIVGMIFVSALATFGATQKMRVRQTQRADAIVLAQDLMSEILLMPYEDALTLGNLGPEPGEAPGTNRLGFDDVDDYDGWSAGPPTDRDGQVLAGADGYARDVHVAWIDAGDLTTVVGADSGVKRIDVTIRRGTATIWTLSTVRTNMWPALAGAGS